MIKLASIIAESTINRVEDISRDDIKVGEGGLNILKSKIEEINKKAKKWGLEPVILDVINEETVKISAPSGIGFDTFKKQYTCRIIGKSPQISGFEFVAKIEHTEGGNLINIAPNSSIKELPAQYRDANAECDICKSRRERFNTFILKDEVANKLIMVGSTCLKRFLPIDDVSKIIDYAEMLEYLRSLSQEELDDADRDYGGTNPHRSHYEISTLIYYLALAYLVDGKYVSKKKSKEIADTTGDYVESTSGMAANIMFYKSSQDEEPNYITRSKEKVDEAKDLSAKILEFFKTHDFKADAVAKPDMANYFNNLAVLQNSTVTNIKYIGYLGGVLASYLINQNMIKKAAEKAAEKPSEFVGQVGQKISFEATLLFKREFSSQYGVTTLYSLKDTNGNRLAWFSSNDIGMIEGKQYNFKVATVKAQQVSKYGGHKETIITRCKVLDMDGQKLNELSLYEQYVII